jgi:hypothetical protein
MAPHYSLSAAVRGFVAGGIVLVPRLPGHRAFLPMFARFYVFQ